jgi:hypothetical protein
VKHGNHRKDPTQFLISERGERLAVAVCDKLGDVRLRQLDQQGMTAAVQGCEEPSLVTHAGQAHHG